MIVGARLADKWSRVATAWLPFADAASADLPLSRLLRLSLFQVSVGMAIVLLNGTLNRVMIVELGLPAWLVSLMIAVPLLFAPFRALVGYRSDMHRSVLGWRRVPYIWFGTLLQFGGLAIMPFALLLMGQPDTFTAGTIGSALAFLLTGAGFHTTQTAGLALATDLATGDKRPRAVALLYVMLLVGMMLSALVIGRLLADFTPTHLVQVVQGAAALTFVINIIALWKQESRGSAPPVDEDVPFGDAWRDYVARPQTARLLTAIGIGAAAFSMQDALLEPFGGEILGLSVGQTTGLTGAWAFGTLAGFAVAARYLDRRTDPLRIAGFGLVSGIAAFLMVLFAAPLGAPTLVVAGAFCIGFGVGLFSVGTLVEAMGLASSDVTGLALGAWGAVQASCAGIAIALGGILRDILSTLAMADAFGPLLANRATAYVAVYSIEICLLLGAIVVLGPLVGRVPGRVPITHDGRFGLTQFPT